MNPTRPDSADASPRTASVDPAEVARFDALAADWWDPAGRMAPLHKINPLRLGFIRDEVCRHFGRDARTPFPFDGLSVLDIGCGAGLLSEPMARLGGTVAALDPASANIAAARRHAEAGGLAIDYRDEPVEAVAARGETFDVVLAMEVVEHVVDVESFVRACGTVVAPGGVLLMATLNRTLRSFALAIVGAEYVLRWLPRGTHDWDKFVTPDELTDAIEAAGLRRVRTKGMVYNPLARQWSLGRDTAVNYLAVAEKPA
jgi:2-polyprenyl-6-hydroxyphenyl methylase/3-demethylubiquinone-9 3-methyltransferase